jgi:uncharacterized protein YceK
MTKGTALLAVGAVCALSGCGTFMNLETYGQQAVYGGVRASGRNGWQCLAGIASPQAAGPDPSIRILLAVMGAYRLAVDTPLCLVGDTVTLPVTIPATLRRWNEPQVHLGKGPAPTPWTDGPGDGAPQADQERLQDVPPALASLFSVRPALPPTGILSP